VLVGINLLREGLDLPEVALVAVLDADKEGFLRSATSLIQTMGRAARNVSGRVIFYAERTTDAMARAIDECERRRTLQRAFNAEHGIVPASTTRSVDRSLAVAEASAARLRPDDGGDDDEAGPLDLDRIDPATLRRRILKLRKRMLALAEALEFERAARLRDRLHALEAAELRLR
jgi:excinuclease ABC subunit B